MSRESTFAADRKLTKASLPDARLPPDAANVIYGPSPHCDQTLLNCWRHFYISF